MVTGEQDQLRDSVRRFLADKSPSAAVRQWMRSEAGFDPAVWRQLTSQLGLGTLAEGGLAELAIVLEETGRALLRSPFFATVALAGQALATCGDEACFPPLWRVRGPRPWPYRTPGGSKMSRSPRRNPARAGR